MINNLQNYAGTAIATASAIQERVMARGEKRFFQQMIENEKYTTDVLENSLKDFQNLGEAE
jgi:hypothetical protein